MEAVVFPAAEAAEAVEEAGSYFSTIDRILLMKTSSALFRCDVAEAMR